MRVNFWTLSLSCLLMALCCNSRANAQVIFDVFDGDTVAPFSNGTNSAPVFGLSPDGTTATLTRTDSALSHFAGSLDLQTLNGGTALTANDVITATWVVDSITGYSQTGNASSNSNGVEFGLTADPAFRGSSNPSTLARFRADSTVDNANRVGFGFGNVFSDGPGQTENEDTVEGPLPLEATADSFADGFTVVQTISIDGVTTQFSDIVVTNQNQTVQDGQTVLTTELEPYADGFDYLDFINGANFYAGAEIDTSNGGVITFSAANIAVTSTAVPEPGTASVLIALGGVFAARRRRA